MADPRDQVAKEISDAWETASRQLAQLREAVLRAAEIAQMKVEQNLVGREKDKGLRDFGEAVWGLVKGGKLQLPATLQPAIKAMQEVEKKIEAQNREILEILEEGNQAASRLHPPPKGLKAPAAVAPKAKKR